MQFAHEAREAGFVTAIALGPEPTHAAIPSLHCTCDGSVVLNVDSDGETMSNPEWLAQLKTDYPKKVTEN